MNKLTTCFLLLGLGPALSLKAAVLTDAPFDDTAEGWTGAGSMTVTHNDGEGTPDEDGALQGSFASQGVFFIPQTGSFRMDVGGSDFLGAYPGVDGITGFTFDFMANTVLPMDVNLRLLSGVNAYTYTLDISGLSAGVWTPFTVFLGDPLWQGVAGVLANVDAVEVQVARGSAAAQLFFLDNFGTMADPYVPPEGGAVPEPSTGVIVIYFGAMLYGMRKRMYARPVSGERIRIGQVRKLLPVALLVMGTVSARAAGIHSESFPTGTAAAEASLSLEAGSWTFTGGVAQVTFMETAPYAIPDVATLRPSAGAFTGNYVEAGIGVMGFRFKSEGAAPSSLYVEMTDGQSIYQRVLEVGPAGQWQTYMVSLDSFEAGGWLAKKGSPAGFTAALSDVRSVAIKIHRSGAAMTQYAIDDWFVDGLPQAAGGQAGSGSLRVGWDALQVGAPYRMERCDALGGPWQDAGTVTPTSRLHHLDIPADPAAPQRFFRLRGP